MIPGIFHAQGSEPNWHKTNVLLTQSLPLNRPPRLGKPGLGFACVTAHLCRSPQSEFTGRGGLHSSTASPRRAMAGVGMTKEEQKKDALLFPSFSASVLL